MKRMMVLAMMVMLTNTTCINFNKDCEGSYQLDPSITPDEAWGIQIGAQRLNDFIGKGAIVVGKIGTCTIRPAPSSECNAPSTPSFIVLACYHEDNGDITFDRNILAHDPNIPIGSRGYTSLFAHETFSFARSSQCIER